MKYAENLKEETVKKALSNYDNHGKRYKDVTEKSCVFHPNSIEQLKQPPISQIWRDHLLALSIMQNKKQSEYEEGFFVFLFPKENKQCQDGVNGYKSYLISDYELLTSFYPRYLDDFINLLVELHPCEWTSELKERYLGNKSN